MPHPRPRRRHLRRRRRQRRPRLDDHDRTARREVTWSADETRLYLLNHRDRRRRGRPRRDRRRDRCPPRRRGRSTRRRSTRRTSSSTACPLVQVLPETDEAILFSQRDGWGHLYLYDLATGALQEPDQRRRARRPRHPARRRRAPRDHVPRRHGRGRPATPTGGGSTGPASTAAASVLLTPEPADHDLVAPRAAVLPPRLRPGQAARPQRQPERPLLRRPPVDGQRRRPSSSLRDADAGGRVVLELERTDVSRLLDGGLPRPAGVHASRPTTASPTSGASSPCRLTRSTREHPGGRVRLRRLPDDPRRRSFLGGGKTSGAHGNLLQLSTPSASPRVIVDGRGTPGRDRAFRQWTFQQFHTARGLEDHVTCDQARRRQSTRRSTSTASAWSATPTAATTPRG